MKSLKYIKNTIIGYHNYKSYWNYEDGCFLIGCLQINEALGDESFFNFVINYADAFVDSDGTITNFEPEKKNVDNFNAGKIFFSLYKITKNEKYKKAADFLMKYLHELPRTISGNFCHKGIYPGQVWLDGLYMILPFYAEYEKNFNNSINYDDIVNQFINVRELMFDEEKGLYYHGYDQTQSQFWANEKTGLSSGFWLRSIGWILMAFIDVIVIMKDNSNYCKVLCDIFKETADGIIKYQDSQTGLFYQVPDRSELTGNYTETSGSCMISYALIKAGRYNILPKKYAETGISILNSVEKYKLIKQNDNFSLTDICLAAGLGISPERDGSPEYYISAKKVADDPKGTGPFMMAYAQRIMYKKESCHEEN